MKYIKYFEVAQSDFEPIESFYIKNALNPKVWNEFKLKSEIRDQLLTIANDFYDSVELKVDILDITLTGSLANYNWSDKYSDFDLHIIINYEDIEGDNDLIVDYLDKVKKVWNDTYDIFISGYEVELYIQDVNEKHTASGLYSVLNDRWIVKPEKNDFIPDDKKIREKSKSIMIQIDNLEMESNKISYDKFKEKFKKIWNKIKKHRKSGLDSESGEFSLGNLVFKLLRRNGYIEKMLNIKKEAYQNQFN